MASRTHCVGCGTQGAAGSGTLVVTGHLFPLANYLDKLTVAAIMTSKGASAPIHSSGGGSGPDQRASWTKRR